MAHISRRTFLRRAAGSAGALLFLYAGGGYRIVSAAEGPITYSLRIVHTNDHHARIEPVSVTIQSASGSTPSVNRNFGGVARRKTLFDQIRQEATANSQNLLVLDAGDVFQGTLYFNQYQGKADLEFYNALAYAAVAVGNHEFDKGDQVLADFIAGAAFPVLSANITVAGGPLAAVVDPSPVGTANGKLGKNIIKTVGGEQIGIFGLTTPDTKILSSPSADVTFGGANPDSSVNVEALAAIAQAQIDALRAAGATKVIGLTHIGYLVDQAIVPRLSGLSIIVGGHSHSPLLPTDPAALAEVGPVGVKPVGPYPTVTKDKDGKDVVIVTDWEWAKWVGDITINFNAAGEFVSATGAPKPVWADGLGSPARPLLPGEKPEITADAAFQSIIDTKYKPGIDELTKTVVGSSEVVLNGERNDVRSKETNLGNLITDAMLNRVRADGGQIAITNGGGIRKSIDAGPVTMGEVLDVLPFGNTIALVTITGAQVIEALENGVSQAESGAGRFPQVAGIRFTWNPKAAPGKRIASVLVQKGDPAQKTFEPIDTAKQYRIVTNNFMLTGGDGYSVFGKGSNAVDTGYILADEVAAYIQANSPVKPQVEGRITVLSVIALPTVAKEPVSVPVRRSYQLQAQE